MKIIDKKYHRYIQFEDYINSLRDSNDKKPLIIKEETYALLQYMKYVIKENGFDISKVINGETKEVNDIIKTDFKDFLSINRFVDKIDQYQIYKFLKEIYFDDDYTCLGLDDRILNNHITKSKKYLLVTTCEVPYIYFENVDIYYKNTISKRKPTIILSSVIYDKINGINRNYINTLENVHKEYDEIIFINNEKDYVDCLDYIRNDCNGHMDKVFALYPYRQISKYGEKHLRLLLDVESIIIDNSFAYIQYQKRVNLRKKETNEINTESKIWIKDLSNIEESELSSILNNNKEIKDISIQVTYEDIEEHNFRIGISTYKNGKDELIDLVDENEKIIERIHRLDKIISTKIDELVVR